MLHDAAGNAYKPEHYLAAFAHFVKENPSRIEAIEFLLKQPERWNPYALRKLREKLKEAPEQFTEENLQKAHEFCFNKATVDIISMVKHAANDNEPLYTAEERVTNAFEKITAAKTFTENQNVLLDKIREHLIANLAIDIEDFEKTPFFQESGGWGRANHIFAHRLNDLLGQLNEAIAS